MLAYRSLQTLKILKDLYSRDTAVKKIEGDASDMKRRAEELTKELEESEKEYEVGKKLHIFSEIVLTCIWSFLYFVILICFYAGCVSRKK